MTAMIRPENPTAQAVSVLSEGPFIPAGFVPTGHRMTPLTVDEQRQVLREGSSVLYNGRIITQEMHLPTEAVMALGDPLKELAAGQHLAAKIEQLRAELESLKAGTLQPAPAPGIGPGVPVAQSVPVLNQPATDPTAANVIREHDIKEAQRRALLKGNPQSGPETATGVK
jgi:hypothetical protein